MPKRSSIEYTNKVLDGETVQKVMTGMPNEKMLETLGSLFQIIGDLTGLKFACISDHELRKRFVTFLNVLFGCLPSVASVKESADYQEPAGR